MPCRTDRYNSLALLPLNHNTNNSNRILMKITELKIGDIVNFGGEKAKVVGISSEDKDSITVQCLEDGGENRIWRASLLDEIDGIPLTEEILEKNGWKEDDEIWSIDYTCGKLNAEVWQWGKEMVITISASVGNDVCTLALIKHAHELQHLLWALGIDDDLKI